jgi:hypothetical protein
VVFLAGVASSPGLVAGLIEIISTASAGTKETKKEASEQKLAKEAKTD